MMWRSYKPALIETTDFGLRKYDEDWRYMYFASILVSTLYGQFWLMALRTISVLARHSWRPPTRAMFIGHIFDIQDLCRLPRNTL